jgi:dihydroxyacetone kinase-like protein
MTTAELLAWLRGCAAELEAHREELTALDAAIGDADHGVNMQRGFQAVLSRIDAEGLDEKDAGSIARGAAMALISTVGGASGPLYGTFFLRFAGTLGARSEFGPAELAAAFRAGLEGLRQRGKAQPGEKTIVDALDPACQALETALAAGQPLDGALRAAEEAARQGMLDTIPLVATKGRASYLGERSRGHQDPGATSAYLMVKAAAVAFGQG